MKEDKKRPRSSVSSGSGKAQSSSKPSSSPPFRKKDNNDANNTFKKVSLGDALSKGASKTFAKKRPFSVGDKGDNGNRGDAKKQKTSFDGSSNNNKFKGKNAGGKGKKEEPKNFKDLKKERQSHKPNFELVEKVCIHAVTYDYICSSIINLSPCAIS